MFANIPHIVRSPQLVLQTRKGNPLDIANFMACLMIGAGYDAYVVVGTAHREVSNMQSQHRSLPYLDDVFHSISKETRKEVPEFVDWEKQLEEESEMSLKSTNTSGRRRFHFKPRLKKLIGLPKSKLRTSEFRQKKRREEADINRRLKNNLKFYKDGQLLLKDTNVSVTKEFKFMFTL
uniref:Uncharacterized protein n=1 Tax=Rhodnius prolixus TaxID=13249 RepID=T1HN44_RHOPR